MGRKKLSEVGRLGFSLRKNTLFLYAKLLKVSRQAIYKLMKAAKVLPKGTVPKRKIGSERKRKTSGRTDHFFQQKVLASPSITAASLKKYSELLKRVSIGTIQN